MVFLHELHGQETCRDAKEAEDALLGVAAAKGQAATDRTLCRAQTHILTVQEFWAAGSCCGGTTGCNHCCFPNLWILIVVAGPGNQVSHSHSRPEFSPLTLQGCGCTEFPVCSSILKINEKHRVFCFLPVIPDAHQYFSTILIGFRIYLQYPGEKYWHHRARSVTFVLWVIRNVIILENKVYNSIYIYR